MLLAKGNRLLDYIKVTERAGDNIQLVEYSSSMHKALGVSLSLASTRCEFEVSISYLENVETTWQRQGERH